MNRKPLIIVLATLLTLTLATIACGGETEIQTVEVIKEVPVEKEVIKEVEVEKVVVQEKVVVEEKIITEEGETKTVEVVKVVEREVEVEAPPKWTGMIALVFVVIDFWTS